MKKMSLLILLAIVFSGCTIIPTAWTTSDEQATLTKRATLHQIQFAKRISTMKPELIAEFLRENIKYAQAYEEIITGEKQDVSLQMEELEKALVDFEAKWEAYYEFVKEKKSNKEESKDVPTEEENKDLSGE